MITMDDYLMGRAKLMELPSELIGNANTIVTRVNTLLKAYGKPVVVSSGFRTVDINKAAGGAPSSKHLICQAVDLKDTDGSLKAWCLSNLKELEKAGLWMEHQDATPTWCHLQSVPPKSGNRVFKP